MGERFSSFTYRFMETDIWVGFNHISKVSIDEVKDVVDKKCRELHQLFKDYFFISPRFEHAFEPIEVSKEAPQLIRELSENSFKTGVGPMAGIAGAFAEEIGKTIKHKFGLQELVIENGGDIYLDVSSDLRVSLYAGEHPLSNKIQLLIETHDSPLGLCASSGKFGHSKSFGKADLVSIACKNTVLADQYATAFANMVQDGEDIERTLKLASDIPEIYHIAIFINGKFGIGGKLKVAQGNKKY